ncbi:hypothetical protein [Methanosarcina sp. UBA5]|uniref:hypothetical protein n=1 Tax=Methanosarcina sp. UBA5 TaxID=1915593 RepID=UPI0025FD89A3|nr:hypothetical protein [Methanosarcina sp. UBA5]
MTSLKLFKRTESYCFDPSIIGKTLRKYRSLQKHTTTYLSLNRFFHLTMAKIVLEFQNQTSEKMALQHEEGLEW